MSQQFLNLDELAPPPELVVKWRGVDHRLKPVTVGSFVQNVKLVQELGSSADTASEFETMKKILLSAFPTMSQDDIDEMTLEHLRVLTEHAMKFSGQKDMEKEMVAEAKASGAENPQ